MGELSVLQNIIIQLEKSQQYSLKKYLDGILSPQDPLQVLPHEIILKIINYLPIRTVLHLQHLSKTWKGEMSCISWKNLFLSQGWFVNRDHSNWKYLIYERLKLENNWNFSRYNVSTFGSHLDSIYSISIHGDYVFTGSRDQIVKCWKIDSRELVKTYQAHSSSVLCLCSYSSTLYSGSSDNSIIAWDIYTGSIYSRFIGHTEAVLSIQANKYLLVSGSKDSTIKVWNIHTGEAMKTLFGHTGSINSIEINDEFIVSASSDKTIRVWSLTTLEELYTCRGHRRSVVSLQFGGKKIVSGSSGNLF
jgi:WD40 repeat protein